MSRQTDPSARFGRSRRFAATILSAAAIAVALGFWMAPGRLLHAQTPSCDPVALNPIVCENRLTGNPPSDWDIVGVGDANIQGFATDISVNRGQTVSFKIKSTSAYQIDIYRMGYYGSLGARKVDSIPSSATTFPNQPACLNDAATGLNDCGNWSVTATWPVPATAVSGIYFAKATRLSGGGGSHIFFIVRDDASTSDLLFQTSDTTWQAYNQYGGNSLYTGSPAGRAYKVSYNRPFNTRTVDSGEDWVFNAEYPMVRFLEANGYNVSYFTGVDSDRHGDLIRQHRVFMSVGHDEYWSGAQRANVETARSLGVNLAFFSGNESFWKTRWENAISADGTPYRTLVCYKETHANAVIDPADPPVWTGTWRDPRFSPPADGGRPENSMSGTIFMVNGNTSSSVSIVVPSAQGKMRFWRNTSVATLAPGASATMPNGTLGYEWDEDHDLARPAGLVRMSDTTVSGVQYLQDFGSTYSSGTANHALTLYRASSGALVFGAGTIQWSWGLDSSHDNGSNPPTPPSQPMQQATINLLADMGVQPRGTLLAGLSAAIASADASPPVSAITSPANGATVPANSTITVSGTASDAGGGVVGGVEVSVDGGATWQRATGLANWSFSWNTGSGRTVTLRSRAVDDSGNLETPAAGVTVTVGSGTVTCPCSIWPAAQTPGSPAVNDPAAVEVGTRFRSDVSGYITSIRFYKGSTNTGPQVGNLWSSSGTLLGSVAFASGTPVGWQQATLPTPVPVTANSVYIVSYHTDSGNYAGDNNYFATRGVDNGPLHALQDTVSTPNGVYKYGTSGFPTQTFQSTNYWVDVVFVTSIGPDTTPPTVTAVSPPNSASGVATATAVTATFSENVDANTITSSTFQVAPAGGGPIAGALSYSAGSLTATFQPNQALANSTTYTATVRGGSTGVKDLAGNALAADVSWSFTTSAPPPPPPTDGPGGPILIVSSSSNPFSRYYVEILRNEGFNAFTAADISTITASTLSAYDVVILGEMPLGSAQVTMFSNWVSGGGKLIAMRPDKQLASLLGLTDAGAILPDAYLQVNTAAAPGAGIVGDTIQFHGNADRYTPSGATVVATLFSSSTTSTANPAVTMRTVGTAGGQAAAFTYDLAKSVVYTRQGNPAWAGQERDGQSPIRSDDLYFGGAQPNYVDLSKVAIPQADEQQRLLANMILSMNLDRKPLPRFWYLPRLAKATVVMTGDDHGNNGTTPRFNTYLADSPAGCSVANWECVRATSYIYPSTGITQSAASSFVSQGFEIGAHVSTNCGDFTPASLANAFASDLAAFATNFPALPAPRTNRTHCIPWSDWDSHPLVELSNGIRFDTNYYYWPPTWVNDTPGMFTGSGMPMRFARLDGTMIDVYQATTQMTDESNQTYPFTIDTLLNNALGAQGYYGVFTANMHNDSATSAGADAIIASAQARGVPIVSSKQMLDWLDGRNGSSFGSISMSGSTLTFTIAVGAGANGLQALVPMTSSTGSLTGITAGGSPVSFTPQTIKGITYAAFAANGATYQVQYGADTTAPVISAVTAVPGNTSATISWTTNEVATTLVNYGTSAAALTSTGSASGSTTSHSVVLTGLTPATQYFYQVTSVDPSGNSATAPASPATFTTTNTVTPTLSIADASLPEGNTGTAPMNFTVTLSAASTQTVTVNYATSNGTATAGSDYTATSGTLTFAPGSTQQVISVPVIGDTVVEPDETFLVTLTTPANATLLRAQATGTILNDDGLPALTIGNAAVTEPDTGSVNATFTVTLSPAAQTTVTVKYATADGTATAGSDYVATTGTLTFAPGTTTQTIAVPVLGDTIDENNETFTVALSAPVNAALGTPSQGTGTINDNDPPPTIGINDVSVTEGNSGTVPAVFNVTLSAPSGKTVTVSYATANGTATAGSGDYVATSGTLTFPPGTVSQTVTVLVNGDTLNEADETFNVRLSSAVNATIADNTGVGTIVNDDPPPALSINDVTVTEGNTGTKNVTFRITLSAASGKTITVGYATADGTALAGSDYVAETGTVTFNPGVTSRSITVAIINDRIKEPTETFLVNLANAVNATIAKAQGTCTILDND